MVLHSGNCTASCPPQKRLLIEGPSQKLLQTFLLDFMRKQGSNKISLCKSLWPKGSLLLWFSRTSDMNLSWVLSHRTDNPGIFLSFFRAVIRAGLKSSSQHVLIKQFYSTSAYRKPGFTWAQHSVNHFPTPRSQSSISDRGVTLPLLPPFPLVPQNPSISRL